LVVYYGILAVFEKLNVQEMNVQESRRSRKRQQESATGKGALEREHERG